MARKNELIDRERYLLLKGMLEDRRREIHEKLRSLRLSTRPLLLFFTRIIQRGD